MIQLIPQEICQQLHSIPHSMHPAGPQLFSFASHLTSTDVRDDLASYDSASEDGRVPRRRDGRGARTTGVGPRIPLGQIGMPRTKKENKIGNNC